MSEYGRLPGSAALRNATLSRGAADVQEMNNREASRIRRARMVPPGFRMISRTVFCGAGWRAGWRNVILRSEATKDLKMAGSSPFEILRRFAPQDDALVLFISLNIGASAVPSLGMTCDM